MRVVQALQSCLRLGGLHGKLRGDVMHIGGAPRFDQTRINVLADLPVAIGWCQAHAPASCDFRSTTGWLGA